MKRSPFHYERPRASLKLTGTVHAVEAKLDHESTFIVAYAQQWLNRQGSPRVPISGVIRRALALYAVHLEWLGEGSAVRSEVNAIRHACCVIASPAEAQAAARQRLEAVPVGSAMPPARDLLAGYDVRASFAEIEARAEACVEQIAQTDWGRLRGLNRTKGTP